MKAYETRRKGYKELENRFSGGRQLVAEKAEKKMWRDVESLET